MVNENLMLKNFKRDRRKISIPLYFKKLLKRLKVGFLGTNVVI